MKIHNLQNIKFTTKSENSIKEEKIELIKGTEVSTYLLKITFENEIEPKPFSLVWEEEQIDMLGFWSPRAYFANNITPEWNMRTEKSKTASGAPIIAIYNKADENKITVALSDPKNPSALRAGVVEETGRIKFEVVLFDMPTSKMKEYEVVIRIDKRKIPLTKSVEAVAKWWEEIGYKRAYVPKSTKMPLYSTWYGFHQHTIPDEIIKECKIAKEYGMDTVIVDDGWQTDDNSRGYAFCGDWRVSKGKIPDMKDFVDRIHALGMKFMIWFSVPYVGFESENYERFKGMYLSTRKHMNAMVLDPRFKEVREFLIDTYEKYVREYGWDGLKLDFIDSFTLSEESSKDYDKMDTISVEEGVERLLCEAHQRLTKINPEFMIEYRQSYVGPVVSQYCNMFRVLDCPSDAILNRAYSLGLRLTSGNTAVHSDMLMWNKNDTPEGVMYQLLGIMFAVPQISVRFDNITSEHKKLLKAFLSFWREHSEILLDGELELKGIDASFTMAKSTKDGHSVAVLYQNEAYVVENEVETNLFNSSGKDNVYIELLEDKVYEIFDIYGEKCESGILQAGVHKLLVKNCQRVRFTKTQK